MNLKLAIPIILILAGVLVWTFAAPYITHWQARRAALKRRMAEGRRKSHPVSSPGARNSLTLTRGN